MQKIILSSKDGKFRFEKEFMAGKTIHDIKEYISQHIKIAYGDVNTDSIHVFHNENVLKDHIVLSKFNKQELSLVFDYTNLKTFKDEGDVLTNSINTKVAIRIIETGAKVYVEPSELITKDNKVYLIRNKSRRINLNLIVELVKKFRICREDVLKVLIFSLLLFTNNGEVLFILGTIFFLRLASGFYSRHKRDFTKKFEHVNRTVLMFVASMFMIDHARF